MITNLHKIKEANIQDIVENYIELKRSGVNLNACCPFHDEKTPSFVVSTGKNIATCFGGCGRSWDPIAFVEEYENLSFPEAVKKVAKISNIPVEYKDSQKYAKWEAEQKERKDKEESLFPALHLVWDRYRENASKLKSTGTHTDFMGRPFLTENLEKFEFGVADSGLITKIYKKEGWDINQLIELGILSEGEKGIYDFFRNRHLLPLKDHNGKIRGIAGRTNNKKVEPKYLNSLDSALFKKSELLFGLFQNRKAIQKKGECIIVEGYTDVITMSEHGFDNAIATCGTALSEQQCELLKRFCDTVIIMRDNDPNESGFKATIRDVEVVIKCGMFAKVVIPEKVDTKSDPDSILREHGKEELTKRMESAQDGLIWRVMLDVNPKDEFSKTSAMELAARLISYIKKEWTRNNYVDRLITKDKLGPNLRKKDFQEAILQEELKREKKNGTDLTPTQERDLKNYGIYIKNNRYFKHSKSGEYSMPLSNFIIEPIYLVASASNPTRMVCIKNIHGHSETIEPATDTFVELGTFKKEISRHGNFRFEGDIRSSDYNQIIAKLYDETDKVFKITTLGWHKKGFWTWFNGITVNGKFQQAFTNGLVECDGVKFILPGKQFVNKNDDALDDTNEDDEYLQLYRYRETGIKLNEYIKLFCDVYGDNGVAGIAFYMASLYWDIIYDKQKSFPILDLFGPKGKGKSTMAWSLSYLFSESRNPIDLNMCTIPGFTRRLNQMRNGIMVCEEFTNNLPDDKFEMLKGVWGSSGRELGKKDSKKGTTNISSTCTIVMCGQDLPIKHIALYERCITLHFNYTDSKKGYEKYRVFNELEQKGVFTQYTSDLQAYRENIQLEFDQTFDQCRAELMAHISNFESPGTVRIIKNHTVLLAVTAILSKHIDLPKINGTMFYYALMDYIVQLIGTQTSTMKNQDELAEFWGSFVYQVESGMLKHYQDFMVEEDSTVRVRIKNTRKDTELKAFDQPTKILYLRFDRAHPLYMEQMRRQGKNPYMLDTIKYYLEISDSYIGEVRAIRFKKSKAAMQCWAFEMEKLPFEDRKSVV